MDLDRGERIRVLTEAASTGGRTQRFTAGETITRINPSDGLIQLVLQGWVARTRLLSDGRRQIVELLLPGEQHGLMRGGFHSDQGVLSAVSDCTVAGITVGELASASEANNRLGGILRACVAQQDAIREEHILCLGRRTALERTGHLFCEFLVRLEGPTARRCELPLTQMQLADVLGLSTVHINRVLQLLRRRFSVEISRGKLQVHDLQSLRDLAEFDPSYLELPDRPEFFPGWAS